MDNDGLVRLCSEAMLLCLLVSLPAVLVAATVGLLVSFVQAVTSIQEQSIGQAAKMISVVIAVVIAAPWGGSLILRHAEALMRVAMA